MIILKSPKEIEKIRVCGKIIWMALKHIESITEQGISTMELNSEAEKFLAEKGAKPAFKGITRGGGEPPYPAALCTSINEEVVHGIPSPKRILRNGDIIGLDLGASIDGYFADAAITIPVGKISPEVQRLVEVTRISLDMAIQKAQSGKRLQDISYSIQAYVESNGFSVVRDFVGHGIGMSPHEDPQIPNFGKPGKGKRLMPGMVLAIEPMVNMGKYGVKILDDKWTAVTADRSYSAHFEHTIAVTDKGPEVLTFIDHN